MYCAKTNLSPFHGRHLRMSNQHTLLFVRHSGPDLFYKNFVLERYVLDPVQSPHGTSIAFDIRSVDTHGPADSFAFCSLRLFFVPSHFGRFRLELGWEDGCRHSSSQPHLFASPPVFFVSSVCPHIDLTLHPHILCRCLSEARENDLVGRWQYGNGVYEISARGDELFFRTASVDGTWQVRLRPEGEWYVADLCGVGFIRLRTAANGVHSSFKKTVGDDWGSTMTAIEATEAMGTSYYRIFAKANENFMYKWCIYSC